MVEVLSKPSVLHHLLRVLPCEVLECVILKVKIVAYINEIMKVYFQYTVHTFIEGVRGWSGRKTSATDHQKSDTASEALAGLSAHFFQVAFAVGEVKLEQASFTAA